MSFRLLMVAALALVGVPAFAQDAAPGISLELNGVVDTPEGECRYTFVANNGLTAPIDLASIEMAFFDVSGAITLLTVLDFRALTVGKTKVIQFDIPGQSCAQIARIVVNDVKQCTTTDNVAIDGCLSALATSSRSSIQFGL